MVMNISYFSNIMKFKNLNKVKILGFLATVLFLSFMLNACSSEKSNDPKPDQKKDDDVKDIPLNSLKSFEYPGVWKAEFVYEKGLFSEIVWGGTDTMDIIYDGAYISEMKSPKLVASSNYNNSNGQLMGFSFNPDPSIQWVNYHYNGNESQPTGYDWLWKKFKNGSWQVDTLYTIRNLQYNAEGGIISADVKNFSAGSVFNATFELISKQNVFFDNTPLHVLPQFIDGAYGLTKVSKQYVKTCTLKKGGVVNTVVKYNYEWDADVDHLPVKITYTPDSNPTEKFFEWNK